MSSESRMFERPYEMNGSVMPVTYRAQKTEKVLLGKIPDQKTVSAAVETLKQELNPIDDIRSTAAYRLKVACNLLEEFLKSPQGR